MHPPRPTVLLTGFGPFPGIAANATSTLVPRLVAEARRTFPGHRIVADVLPTEWHAGPERLHALIERWRPAVALHFGVSRRAGGFAVEARACNATAADTLDAAGRPPARACVAEAGADYLATNLPAQHIVDRLRRRGLPAIVSRDAGTYLCNTILYSSLARAHASAGTMTSGFIHIPPALAGLGNPQIRSLPGIPLAWPDALDGGLEIIATCLGLPPRPCSRRRAAMRGPRACPRALVARSEGHARQLP